MGKIIQKTSACILCLTTAFSLFACSGDGSNSSSSSVQVTGDIEIWSKASTVNVRRDDEYSDAFKEDAKYSILAGKGEYEASQIIITTPAGKTAEYTIEVSDLTCGDYKIDKSYVDVYNEKYINVVSSTASNTTGTGWYADALLPFDTAVKYGENVVGDQTALRNQGIYIETFIPRDIPAGVYTGTFKLTVDGETTSIPASATVCDFEVSQVSHLEQDWIVNLKGFGELDSTAGMNRKYFEEIAKYRAGTHSMSMGAQSADEWVETVRKYTNPNLRDEEGNPLIGEKESYLAGINLPASYDATYGINRTTFDNYISRLVYWSVKDNFDYLAKVGTYPGFIDEPHWNGTWTKVKFACDGWNTYKNLWADDIVAKEDVKTINAKLTTGNSDYLLMQEDFDALSGEFKTQLAKSMSLIGFYVTSRIDERLDNNATTQFCCPIDTLNTQQKNYNLQNWTDVENSGNWAYGAGNSTFGNRLDSEPVEQRLMSYKLYDCDIKGFLVWEVAQYQQITWNPDARANQFAPCDPYDLAQRISNGAGDGYILYPGKPYGIYGPVGSIRAHQYRDSSEEYEYFYLLEQLYEEHGYSPKAVLRQLFSWLYNESNVTADTEIFATQRRQLINLVLLAQQGVFVTDYTQFLSNATMQVVSVGDENIVSVNGETVAETKSATVTLDMTTKAGSLSFATSSGIAYSVYLGGQAKLLKGADTTVMTMAGGTATADTVNGVNSVRFDFAPDESIPENKRVYQVTFAASKADISRETGYLTSDFYNPTDKAVLVELWFMGTDNRTMYVDDIVIYPHQYATMVTTRLDALSWGTIRSLEGVRYKVTSLEGETNYSVHFFGLYTVN